VINNRYFYKIVVNLIIKKYIKDGHI